MSSLDRRVAKHRAKPPGVCLFCGGGGLSREHIWPQWASDLLPVAPYATLSRYSKSVYSSGPHQKEHERTRQGGLKGHRIRAVCRTCNNGWMSRLEEEARPVLTDLMLSENSEIGTEDQKTVAEWLTLKLMVAEHDMSAEAVMLPNERRALFERRKIPDSLGIWVFKCGQGAWRSGYYRSAFTLARIPQVPNPLTKNVFCTVMGIADLLAVAIYDGPAVMGVTLNTDAGFQLWPATPGEPIQWPPAVRLTHAQAMSLAHTAERFALHPNVRLSDELLSIGLR